jgi:putative transcriptional regulator
MEQEGKQSGYFGGQFLIAMPSMPDPRFERSVIYMLSHSAQSAMGIVVNKPLPSISFKELAGQLGIEKVRRKPALPIHFGGPVEQGRGFVLHSPDYMREATIKFDETLALTATIDVLKAIAEGEGPERCILALGYAGWAPGQLDTEIQQNSWLTCPLDREILFDSDDGTKWTRAIGKLGIDPSFLTGQAGHA